MPKGVGVNWLSATVGDDYTAHVSFREQSLTNQLNVFMFFNKILPYSPQLLRDYKT